MTMLLEDKVAIVTGGSRGLGLAIASALGVAGARILVVSRSEEACRAAVLGLKEKGIPAASATADIALPESAERVVAAAASEFGRLDILVNSAGVFLWKKFLELTPEDWRQTLDTNLAGPFFLTHAAARYMIDQGQGGSIINITSIHGSVAEANVVAHCASKFGLTGLTLATAEALREFDIRVNAIAPGSIAPDSAERRGESPRRKITQADVANLAVYLASDLSRSLTGITIDALGSTRTVIKA